MPQLTSRTYHNREHDFSTKYSVSVTKEGVFSTTLAPDAVEVLTDNGVLTSRNRQGRFGHFSAATLDELEKKVRAAFEEAFSRELVDRKLVLQYQIGTACAYSINEGGEYIPNCGSEWTKAGFKGGVQWHEGTLKLSATSQRPYGLLLYVEPVVKESYQYKSGKVATEHVRAGRSDWAKEMLEEDRCLRWLCGIVSMDPIRFEEMQEIDYDRSVGRFFVDLLTGLFELNERIQDFVSPKMLKELAHSGSRLLGTGEKDAR